MEKIVEQGLLYDFYGELLTEHQRRIYEDMVLNDLSPSEIAKEQGISRQSVHDLKKRCDKMYARRRNRSPRHRTVQRDRYPLPDCRRTPSQCRDAGFLW